MWYHSLMLSRFSLCLCLSTLIMMCLGMKCFLEFLEILDIQTSLFHQIWEVFSHYVFKYSFCLFLSFLSGTLILCALLRLMVCHRSLMSLTISFSFFLFLRENNLNWMIFKLNVLFCFSANLSLLLSLFTKFFLCYSFQL